ncbi:MAG: hypothetical protein HYZ26_02550 [Chloroflexi bacterium]|nr:hypothetical protein [Chloroflexota bacterium]
MNKREIRKQLQGEFDEVKRLAREFAAERLSQEYADLVDALVDDIAKEQPGLILKGRAKSWAGAVLYVLGQVNFLFDSSQTPHMQASELCAAFGVSQASVSPKARQIREALDIFQMDPRYTLASNVDDNLLVWMLMVNGYIVDIRTMPREVQVIAFEKGLIPYIPADQEEGEG